MAGKARSTWEAYLTGQVGAEPKGPSWVREQLGLYGLLPPEGPRSSRRRRGGSAGGSGSRGSQPTPSARA